MNKYNIPAQTTHFDGLTKAQLHTRHIILSKLREAVVKGEKEHNEELLKKLLYEGKL